MNKPSIPDHIVRIAKEEGGWQKFIKRRHTLDGKLVPDPAAAPLGTDQEAGGSITTPEGSRQGPYKP
jgi:hypothetical protein